jgi:hypothetical protein
MNRPGSPRLALALVIVLLVAHLLISHLAVRGKSATFDEPLHAGAGWVIRHFRDFRVNCEDPPLWQYWAMLPHDRNALRPDFGSYAWQRMPVDPTLHWKFVCDTLYLTPGVPGHDIMNTSRAMMLVWPAALIALVAAWAWRLAGPGAAVLATALIALDANFLAHSSLVKNDVPFTAVLTALGLCIWSMGRRMTISNLILAALVCGVGLSVKFSGILLPPILILALVARALAFGPWVVMGRTLNGRGGKLAAALAACVVAAPIAWTIVWATYGFRFLPTSDPNIRLNSPLFVQLAAEKEMQAKKQGRPVTRADMEAWRPGPVVRLGVFLEEHKLMPQAWTAGLLYTHMSVQIRGSYLLGEYSLVGWRSYFPLAMLFKTPTATLIAMALALAVAILWLLQHRILQTPAARWNAFALLLGGGLYMASAIASNLNLGLRHALPAYPMLFIGVAWVGAKLIARKPARAVAGVLLLGLAVESLAAYPNFIPFFNEPCTRLIGKLKMLGDSNLDWGQDLPLLAEWQKRNLDRPLYLTYFGTVYPEHYGINYVNLPGGYFLRKPDEFPEAPGVIAISATHLQSIYHSARTYAAYEPYRRATPFEVLGGSIYLFEYKGPPPPLPNERRN